MSSRKLKSSAIAPGPGAYRVTWSADFGAAAGPEDAASQARDFLADLLARGGSLPFLAERHDDKRQGKLLFGLASVPVKIECPAVAAHQNVVTAGASFTAAAIRDSIRARRALRH